MQRFLAAMLLCTFTACAADDESPDLAPDTDPPVAGNADEDVDDTAADVSASSSFTTARYTGPARTAVYAADGRWLATFTDGARTVRLRGPSRSFAEPTTAAAVVTRNWVRLLDAPFDGTVDRAWLAAALADASPDILAIATEYVTGASRDASYGPMVDGLRQEGSDFHDYLGMDWRFPTGTMVRADPAQLGSLDCSGFQRMVWGYRGGIELALTARADRGALPRKSADIYAAGPGVITIPNGGAPPVDLATLFAGDLLFFDISTDDGAAIDHVGLYLGLDSAGHPRFVSSRKTADGPTLGDVGGASVIDGAGLYARGLRAARRL